MKNNFKIYTLLTFLFVSFFLGSVNIVQAELLNVDAVKNELHQKKNFSESAGLNFNLEVAGIVGPVVNVFLSLLGVVFVGLMLYGGYIYMMAKGDEEKVNQGLGTVRRAIIGLIITVGAFSIWKFIYSYFVSK